MALNGSISRFTYNNGLIINTVPVSHVHVGRFSRFMRGGWIAPKHRLRFKDLLCPSLQLEHLGVFQAIVAVLQPAEFLSLLSARIF